MILMVLSTIATCGIYYLLILFITKDKTFHYALNLVLTNIKKVSIIFVVGKSPIDIMEPILL